MVPSVRSQVVGVLLLLALVVSLGAWSAAHHLNPRNFGVVAEGKVYRSAELEPAALARVVRERGIRTIIDFRIDDPEVVLRREQKTAEALGVERIVLPMEGDGQGNLNNYIQALRIMTDPARQPVLVHCAAGAQRTGCASGLYRIVVEGWTPERAFDEALSFDHDPAKNPHVRRILEVESARIGEAFRSGGTLPDMPAVGRSTRDQAP
ncbi:MAG: tyrosine-protein phosphatase [Planctomycetota bacterium]|nr:tyrosine-protein phosphatase [Planctomycetota bacterium]